MPRRTKPISLPGAAEPAPDLCLTAPAKINLSLRILGRRDDGYHDLTTRMCRISLADRVEITRLPAERGTVLTCSDRSVPADESNLAIKALRLFEARTGIHHHWRIHLEKRIPAGAGLGGGSANAAATLRGLNRLCDSPLTREQLLVLGAELGSDVPFFLLDETAAEATGRGERVVPIEFPWQLPLVLIKPPFPIATPWAYLRWSDSRRLNGPLYAPQLCPWGELYNDLERPVFEKHRFLPALKDWLLGHGECRAALMSGSGSTMFAVCRKSADAERLADLAREWCGETSWVSVAFTVPSVARA